MENSNFTAEDARKISLREITLNDKQKEIYLKVVDMIKKASENREMQIRFMTYDSTVHNLTEFGEYENLLIAKFRQDGYKTKIEFLEDLYGRDKFLIIKW